MLATTPPFLAQCSIADALPTAASGSVTWFLLDGMVGCTGGVCYRKRKDDFYAPKCYECCKYEYEGDTINGHKKLGDRCGRGRPAMLLVGGDAKFSLCLTTISAGKAQVRPLQSRGSHCTVFAAHVARLS